MLFGNLHKKNTLNITYYFFKQKSFLKKQDVMFKMHVSFQKKLGKKSYFLGSKKQNKNFCLKIVNISKRKKK